MNRSRFSTSQHLVPLMAKDTVFSPDWGLSCITSIYDHILWGPDTMLTRSMSLNSVMAARFAVLATMPRAVRDKHKGGE